MAKIYTISPDYLKDYVGYLNDNIDNDLLKLSILEAQDIELQSLLGTNLYNSILNKIDNNTLSGDTTYSNLFDNYIVKVVVYNATKRSISKLLYKFNNKNIGVKDSDNTQPIDFQTLNFLKSSISNDAEFYNQRLIDHLQEDYSLYSEFATEDELDEIYPNRNTTYNSGMDLSSNSIRKSYRSDVYNKVRVIRNND